MITRLTITIRLTYNCDLKHQVNVHEYTKISVAIETTKLPVFEFYFHPLHLCIFSRVCFCV